MRAAVIRFQIAFLLVLLETPQAWSADKGAPNCNESTWQACSKVVLDELSANRSKYANDPDEGFRLLDHWDKSYTQNYLGLKGQPRSKSDIEKIEEEITGKINPLQIGKDKAIDIAIKKYLPRLAPVMSFIAAPVKGIQAFLEPSEIASDLDDLKFKNKQVHDQFWAVMSPYLFENWKGNYSDLLQKVPDYTDGHAQFEKDVENILETSLSKSEREWNFAMRSRMQQLEQDLAEAVKSAQMKDLASGRSESSISDVLAGALALAQIASNGKNAAALECAEGLLKGTANSKCLTWGIKEADKNQGSSSIKASSGCSVENMYAVQEKPGSNPHILCRNQQTITNKPAAQNMQPPAPVNRPDRIEVDHETRGSR